MQVLVLMLVLELVLVLVLVLEVMLVLEPVLAATPVPVLVLAATPVLVPMEEQVLTEQVGVCKLWLNSVPMHGNAAA